MPYNYTPHVGATYLDGSLRQPVFSTQPKILVLGTASSGLTDERFDVASSGSAEVEFGSSSDVCRGMHEVMRQGADNISIMRIGGKLGNFVFTDSDTATLTITPSFRDAEIMERYALVMETTASNTNRILVYDLIDQGWVYDSEEILVINEGIVDVDDTGIDLFTVNDINDPDGAINLEDLVTGDFTVAGTATAVSAVDTAGTDGTSVSKVETYAALNRAYYALDFQDADYIIAKGVYIDDQNIVDGDTCNFFKGVPVPGEVNDTLGYVWQYEYQGQVYTYFVDQADYFSETQAAATVTINTDLVITAVKTGTGGNSISISMTTAGGTPSSVVTITEPAWNTLHIAVVGDNTVTNALHRTAINLALAAFTMANGQLASTIVTATSGGATTTSIVASTPLAGGLGGHVLTHDDLTGDSIPSVVSTAFTAAGTNDSDSQLREVNFAHQLATFCKRASTTWKSLQGAISVNEPPGFSRMDLATWVGSPPHETRKGLDLCIDVTGDNGTGLFAIKLMAGLAASAGYRAHMIEEGDTGDGYLFGGIIATSGLSLPNQDTDLAYGINDDDEAVDENGFPVDIGKHIHVLIDWPVHRNAFNGGVNYRGSIEGSLVGLLATMPANEEPIGRSFPLKGITSVPRIHASQRDALSKFRFDNIRFESGAGWVFNTVRTAAHPLDCDYTRSSTIRCVSRELNGIRNIAKNYLGKAFSGLKIANLQADIDGFLKAEGGLGFHQGAVALLSYTREDRILGKLTVRIQMVPPFTIEQITEVMSLAAEASELE